MRATARPTWPRPDALLRVRVPPPTPAECRAQIAALLGARQLERLLADARAVLAWSEADCAAFRAEAAEQPERAEAALRDLIAHVRGGMAAGELAERKRWNPESH
ncbi:MAG: hypothetical protein AMXMBFR72_32080 [Betaproteobacteria bacterium]